jgi:hypothetical protein
MAVDHVPTGELDHPVVWMAGRRDAFLVVGASVAAGSAAQEIFAIDPQRINKEPLMHRKLKTRCNAKMTGEFMLNSGLTRVSLG